MHNQVRVVFVPTYRSDIYARIIVGLYTIVNNVACILGLFFHRLCQLGNIVSIIKKTVYNCTR